MFLAPRGRCASGKGRAWSGVSFIARFLSKKTSLIQLSYADRRRLSSFRNQNSGQHVIFHCGISQLSVSASEMLVIEEINKSFHIFREVLC